MSEEERPWVTVVAHDEADGALREAYDAQARRLGEPTEFVQLGSLYPELALGRLEFYKIIDQLPSGLSDIEKHAVIYVTSVLNQAPYCASGACHKLEFDGASDELIARLAGDRLAAGTGSARLDEIVRYTTMLTRSPTAITAANIDALRGVGLSDGDIVVLNNLAAYFAYCNRITIGLGLLSQMPAAHAVGLDAVQAGRPALASVG
jgi:uncharacterized peroxidase-related enzyme